MLLGFHESVFHFCLLETTYIICVKCCHCIPIDSTPFAQFFLLKVNGNLVIYSPPIHTGDLLVTVHNLQQKIQKKEKHGFHLQSMGLSRFLDLFLLQTLSVKSGRDQKNPLDTYEDRPFSYMHKNPVVFWWQLVWEGKALQGFFFVLESTSLHGRCLHQLKGPSGMWHAKLLQFK